VDPVIETKGLSKNFRSLIAVDGLDLHISRGEIFGLVGPDGAGKTTTLRLLAGISRPSAGSAHVGGFDTDRQAGQLKHIVGYMPQRFSLYSDLTVSENLNFYADVFNIRQPARGERIERLLRFAGLTEFRRRRAWHLSGGMKQKLALACTLLHEPPVLLLDEPTTGVDPVSRREFWDILTEIHLGGVTLVVSTPYMDEAERCSRVGLMYQGRIVVAETPDRIRGMIHGEVIELRLREYRRARQELAGLPGVLELQAYGELLHVIVDDADRRLPEVTGRLTGVGIPVLGARITRARMEEAFISLVRQQAAAAGQGHG
jgi:ABC-2 type transport system ATP-binding protein